MANKERVQLLVTALRSGKYRQGRYALNGYDKAAKKRKLCCLGVACEVARLTGLDLKMRKDEVGDVLYNGHGIALPTIVADWYGFDDLDPSLVDAEGVSRTAVILNDESRYTFGKIADAFERTYLNNNNTTNTQ